MLTLFADLSPPYADILADFQAETLSGETRPDLTDLSFLTIGKQTLAWATMSHRDRLA